MIDLIKDADFVPLLRPQIVRYAQAGFPTKVPESLSLGTPIICNLTSDLGDFIRDESEGIICRDYSIDAFVEALENALTLSPTNRKNMGKAHGVKLRNPLIIEIIQFPKHIFGEDR